MTCSRTATPIYIAARIRVKTPLHIHEYKKDKLGQKLCDFILLSFYLSWHLKSSQRGQCRSEALSTTRPAHGDHKPLLAELFAVHG
jgi:hypothetical protein